MKRALVCFALVLLTGCADQREAPPVTLQLVKAGGRAAELERGRQVFITRCIECHSLPAIAQHSREGWPRIVHWMAPRAGLTPAEQEALTAYVLAVHAQR